MAIKELKTLIAEGRIKEALYQLLEITTNTRHHNEVVQQASRWNELQRTIRNGTSTDKDVQQTSNQVTNALLQILDLLDENQPKPPSRWWKYIVGMGVLVGIAVGVIAGLKHLGIIEPADSTGTHSITVLIHGANGKADVVLPNRGLVYLIYGDAKVPEQINNEGEATFKQIDERFFQEGASVEFIFEDPEGEPYRLRYPDSVYQLKKGQYLALEALLEGMDQLEGTVKDFVTREPIDSVHIRIRGNSYFTNEFGEFTLDIPQDRQSQFIDMRLEKAGYEPKELQNVPTTTDRAQIISLKPLQ